MRPQHEVAKYVFHQQRYFKQFPGKFKDKCSFISSAGETDHAVSVWVRAHNTFFAPSDPNGPTLAAQDHDWNVAGIVLNINLFSDLPDSTIQSFFVAWAIILLKKKIFEKSSLLRYATELYNQVKETNGGNSQLNKEIPLLVTNGGGYHNVTYASVQISLITLVFQLNKIMFVAMRICPTQSWASKVKRFICILN